METICDREISLFPDLGLDNVKFIVKENEWLVEMGLPFEISKYWGPFNSYEEASEWLNMYQNFTDNDCDVEELMYPGI